MNGRFLRICHQAIKLYSFTITHDKDADWPIRLTDDTGKDYDLELEPGQMLYYIGADYEHGRLTAFEGRATSTSTVIINQQRSQDEM